MSTSSEENTGVSSSQGNETGAPSDRVPNEPNALRIGGIRNIQQIKHEILIECNRRAYLDGKYFSPILDKSSLDGGIVAVCQLCETDLKKYKEITGYLKVPSNYTTHIKRIHNAKLKDYKEYVQIKHQKKKDESNGNDGCRSYCTFSQSKFEENIILFLLETLTPLNTVEAPGFRKIFDDMRIKKNGVSLHHLSARTIGRRIQVTFEENVLKIIEQLSTVTNVCTTADVWSSRTRRFLGMTVHWIDETTLKRKSHAIACRRFTGNHSYDKVAEMITDIHSSYGIDSMQVIATITDNGSNFVKAFREFGLKFGDFFFQGDVPVTPNNDEFEIEIDHSEIDTIANSGDDELTCVLPQHIRCASHTLNLVASTDAIAAVKSSPNLRVIYSEMIERCNALWRLSSSPKQCEKLTEYLGKSVKRPIVTRWNSLYDSLTQILSLKDKLIRVPNEIDLRISFRETDFKFMEEYIRCNRPIAEALDLLQGEKYCFYGYLLPTLISVRNKLRNCIGQLQSCEKLATALIDNLSRRFENIFAVVDEGRISAVAAASHPAFKLKWLNCLTPSAQANVLSAIKDSLVSNSDGPGNVEEMQVDLDEFFDFSCDTPTTSNEVNRTFGIGDREAVFQKFLSETRTDLELLNAYPIVKEVFLKFNTVLPSSAPVERLFSYATMFDLPKYNRLNDENFELRVLMRANANRNE